MCELFALSSRKTSAVKYSIDEFARYGSGLRRNRQGWGVAFAKDRDTLVIKEVQRASRSRWVDFLENEGVKSHTMLAHVRLATRGRAAMENTHPFRHVLGGRSHVFAHNGTLKRLKRSHAPDERLFGPIGQTDSELAFSILMQDMHRIWEAEKDDIPPFDERMDIFAAFCTRMRRTGPANFLYYDGDTLFAHAHKRSYERRFWLTRPKPPGLQMKKTVAGETPETMQMEGIDIDTHRDRAVLLASVPLDDDGWEPLPENTVIAIRDGREVARQGGANG